MLDFALSLVMILCYAFLLALGLIVGLFFLALIYAAIFSGRDEKRVVAKLAESKCVFCGTPFGIEVATRAPEEYAARCQKIRRENPGHRINFVKTWTIQCPACQREDYFDFREEKLCSHVTEREEINADSLVQHIHKQTSVFPQPRPGQSLWHVQPPVPPCPLHPGYAPFDTCHFFVQALIDRAHHLASINPSIYAFTRVVVAINLPELGKSQIVVFFGSESFGPFFERNTTLQKWTPIGEEWSLAREWELRIPPGFTERGIQRELRDPYFNEGEEVWFIGQLAPLSGR